MTYTARLGRNPDFGGTSMKKNNVRVLTGVLLSTLMLIAMIGTFAFAFAFAASAADGDACASTANCTGTYENGICNVCDGYEPAVYNEQKGYYEISNAGMLYWFMEYVNAKTLISGTDTIYDISDDVYSYEANAVLTADIVVNENVLAEMSKETPDVSGFRAWFPIGYDHDRNGDGEYEFVYFEGTFDGQGHTVSGLYFNNTEQSNVGLFGQTRNGAIIRNVGVIDAYFQAGDYVGGVVGDNRASVQNCYNETTSRVPMTDWYDTISGLLVGFIHRTVQGGLYIKMLDESKILRYEK